MIAWVAAALAEEPPPPPDLLRLHQSVSVVHYAKAVALPPDRPPVLRGRARSGPIEAWAWPDGTVARWRQSVGRGASVEHLYDAEGIPLVTVERRGGAPQKAIVAGYPPVEVDLAGWTPATVGPATLLGPGAATDGAWEAPAGILGLAWEEEDVDVADPAFATGLAEGCGCLLSDRTTALADGVAGVRWTLAAPHLDAPMIGELWAFPRPGGVVLVEWTTPAGEDPGRPELAPGRAAVALLSWGKP